MTRFDLIVVGAGPAGSAAALAAVCAAQPVSAYHRGLRNSLGRHIRQSVRAAQAMRNPLLVDAVIAAMLGDAAIRRQVVEMAFSSGTVSFPRMIQVALRYLIAVQRAQCG